jgi:ABC-type glycerol-3-phosphate transport system substrate-binding protein
MALVFSIEGAYMSKVSAYGVCFSLVASFILAALLGCAAAETPAPQATPPPSPTVAQGPTPSPSPYTPPAAITLTLWTTEAFIPSPDTPTGEVMEGIYRGFQEAHPDIAVQFVPKRPYGKGGILDFLLTAGAVAPQTLPDLVTIDLSQVELLVGKEILQPWDGLIPEEVADDLLPHIRQAGSREDQLLAFPFQVDIEHLVYSLSLIDSPPRSWDELRSLETTYAFPAAGEEGVNSFLIQYLALGGSLVDEEGNPDLDGAAIAQVLEFYRDGYAAGYISPSVLEMKRLDDSWALFKEGGVAMANVSSQHLLMEGTEVAYAPLPTKNGNQATMARPWAFLLVTPDPRRQEAAAEFVKWFLTPENLTAWAQASGHLPTSRSALRLAIEDIAYRLFARRQMETAYFRPWNEEITTALQQAVVDVLRGNATPQQAVDQVIQTLE